ncbi:hypothetical protein CLV51_103313 [Chitinophaga niastensis]|uniref:AAA+ ATPase domain-containing protein n=1 Tax=Chitinophaga niastensis TaxID=536980 RepID=A0A2P8HJF7_CHINA|nr:ATP-binding protein [Chitinophaga niastensis]PSL46335.1 hypothetical protein CLV51_103313 [Chitinophaga niastensis]
MDITKIQTAFFPSREITDPDFFVGRHDEIKDSMVALSEEGSFIAIHGLRGVGKTSIAKQIKLIAEGNTYLSRILNLEKYIPRKGFNYLTITTTCDLFTRSTYDIVKRIVFGDNESAGLLAFTSTGDRRIESIKESFKTEGSVGLFGLKVDAGSGDEITYKTILTDDLIQQFKQILGAVQKDNQSKSGILIIIDEFDVLKDKKGFASIVKSCSNNHVKFAISGIAGNITEIIEDHTSIGRQLHNIHVNLMPEDELYGIISRAEHHIANKIYFAEDAKYEMVKSAEGFPYFVHLLGKQALLDAFETGKMIISQKDIMHIEQSISKGRLRTIYEEIYHSAVKESPQRELLLKLFAEEKEDVIFSEPVYASAKDFGVKNPSQLMKELITPQGQTLNVLTKIREKYFRFTDPVFKVYAKLRTWKFENR